MAVCTGSHLPHRTPTREGSVYTMTYEELKYEFRMGSFRERMKEACGTTCVNCGREDGIEYHHIVPLRLGGTNNLRNIVPLCGVCHQAAHKKIVPKDYVSKHTGRKRVMPKEGYKDVLWLFACGEIGRGELMERLGEKGRLTEKWWFNEFLNDNGMEKIINLVDRHAARRSKKSTRAVVVYRDGTQRRFEGEVVASRPCEAIQMAKRSGMKVRDAAPWTPVFVGDMSPEYRKTMEKIWQAQ